MSKKSQAAVVSAAILLSLLSLATVSNVSGQSSRGKEKDAEVQWEYMVVSGGTSNLSGVGDLGQRKQPDNSFREATVIERNLDKLGQKGWELVTVQGTPVEPIYYLKRPKEVR